MTAKLFMNAKLSPSLDLYRKPRRCTFLLGIYGKTSDKWGHGDNARRSIITAMEDRAKALLPTKKCKNEMRSLPSGIQRLSERLLEWDFWFIRTS